MCATAAVQEAEKWVEAYGDKLYRHALARVRNAAVAEDLVQETFVSAWKSRHSSPPAESEPAWLLGILRNKVADYFRHRSRREAAWDPDTLAELEEAQFSAGGWCGPHWLSATGPRGWGSTAASLQSRDFFRVLTACTEKLPGQAAQVFLLRELDGQETSDICATLAITPNHLFVLLHRARLALRRCLELNWFGHKSSRTEGSPGS